MAEQEVIGVPREADANERQAAVIRRGEPLRTKTAPPTFRRPVAKLPGGKRG